MPMPGRVVVVDTAASTARRSVGLPRLSRALAWLEREGLAVLVVATYAAGVLVRMPNAMLSDSWMTLVAGRTILHHGLPTFDKYTTWAQGVRWVDQQWLAQIVFGGLALLGGVKLAVLGNAVAMIAGLALAVVAARRLGGGPRSVPLVATLAIPQLAGVWLLRAQSLTYVMFAALVWLLVADARSPSRRIVIAFPLLILWANLHGSVVIAATLVALRGITVLAAKPRQVGRGVALVLVPWLCVFASPYAATLPSYYRSIFFNQGLPVLVTEWATTSPSLMTAPFYLLAFGGLALLARRWKAVPSFERLAFLILLVAGMLALRNMVWFSLASIILVPPRLDDVVPAHGRHEAQALVKRGLPALALCVTAVLAVSLPARSDGWYERSYPAKPAALVAAAAARDPSLAVFADGRYADWLLWRQPSLTGRISYDARFELLTNSQLVNIYFWRSHIGRDWPNIAGCRAIVLVNLPEEPTTERALLREHGTRRLYRDSRISILVRSSRSHTCSRHSPTA
jgi:hypothetical protein